MILKLIKNDRFRDAKVNFLEAKRHEDLEAVERLKAQEKTCTKRFMNGEILIFAKGPLVSFIYGVIDVFAIPKEYVRGTFDKNDILK